MCMKDKCNAKINIGLKITGIKNGYHMLDSTFVPISLYDYVEIEVSNKDEIIGMDIDMNNNIMYKALKLMKNKYNIEDYYRIKIDKNIPMQAGLGGGSSDAALVLHMLNEMNNLDLSNAELAELALEIGSDVPFFIYNKPSKVKGRGEIINILDNFKKIYGVLIFDNLHFNTKIVYDTYDSIEKKEEIINDLELAARMMSGGERIKKIEKDLLDNGAYMASLTGSGGAIFGLFEDMKSAINAENKLIKEYAFVKSFESI